MSTDTQSKMAVVLLSGGVDSTTCLALACKEGYEVYALTVDYGQRHRVEIESAARVAEAYGARHVVVGVDLRAFGGSALTGDIGVPKGRSYEEILGGIPITYVPARNTVFLALALGLAEVIGAEDIFIGVNALDYSGYPDCRLEFVKKFEELARLATKAGVEGRAQFVIHSPLIHMSKAEIIKLGHQLGVDYSLTFSCYDPGEGGRPCGSCDACLLREKGFREAGLQDPLVVGG